MSGLPQPEIEYRVTARPAHRKAGEDAWEPITVERFKAPDHAETAVARTTDVLQPHLDDFEDDDLIVVTRADGTELFPEPQPVSDFRRRL